MCVSPIVVYNKYLGKGVQISCGRCLECALKYSNEWAFRMTLEALQFENNCIVTLTYNDENLPSDGRVSKRDFQLFMKRLRKSVEPLKIRFFGCGEYGSRRQRPHYHIALFNYKPSDLVYFFSDKQGHSVYKSNSLSDIWKKGFVSVIDFDFSSSMYTAKYLQKLNGVTFDKSKFAWFLEKNDSFVLMSRKPAIGFNAIREAWFDTDRIYYRGKSIAVPRYFLRKYMEDGEVDKVDKVNDILEKRKAVYNRLTPESREILLNCKFERQKNFLEKISVRS